MTIKKADMGRFLKRHLLPLFGEGWFVYDKDTLLRINGTLYQGVTMERSGFAEKFIPCYFVNILAVPTTMMSLMYGSRMRRRTGTIKSLLGMRYGGFLWLEWDPGPELAKRVYDLVCEQARPGIRDPLDFETVGGYIEKHNIKKGMLADYYALFALGVIRGLEGRRVEAESFFMMTKERCRERIEEWRRGEPPEYLDRTITDAEEALSHLLGGDFQEFCEQQTAKTKAILKLPE